MAQTRLKQLREEAVLTVHELSEASGVSDDTISKIENGQRVARPSTLRKLAGALDISPQELRRPAKVEESVPLDKAPRGAEQLAKEAEEPEEEQRVIPQAASSIKSYIEDMKKLEELREAELEEIGTGKGVGLRDALPFQMELADEGLRGHLQELGVLDFAKAVSAGREMADPEAIPLCIELLRRLNHLEALSAQARAASRAVAASIHVERKKGPSEVEAWLHKQPQGQRSPES